MTKNHRWVENKCLYCGLTREKREAKIHKGSYSCLTRSGVWDDREVVDYRFLWWYGPEHKFDRPDCSKSG